MFAPKEEIYAALAGLGYYCRQSSQAVITDTEVPAITFRIDSNSVNTDLDNEIASQEVIVAVDIWTDDSSEGTRILSEVEQAMRSLHYRLSNSADVPQPTGCSNHITCQFIAIKAQS